jgi:hypothetical protein
MAQCLLNPLPRKLSSTTGDLSKYTNCNNSVKIVGKFSTKGKDHRYLLIIGTKADPLFKVYNTTNVESIVLLLLLM